MIPTIFEEDELSEIAEENTRKLLVSNYNKRLEPRATTTSLPIIPSRRQSMEVVDTFKTSLDPEPYHPQPKLKIASPTKKTKINIQINNANIRSKISLKAMNKEYLKLKEKLRRKVDATPLQKGSYRETKASKLKRMLHQSPPGRLSSLHQSTEILK